MNAPTLVSILFNAMVIATTLGIMSHGSLGSEKLSLLTWSISLSSLCTFLVFLLDWPGVFLGTFAVWSFCYWSLHFHLREASISAGILLASELFTFYLRS